MAKKITPLNAGQAPSLLDTTKANEVINTINALTSSSASAMAELGGLSLRVTDEGKIELDISQNALDALQRKEISTPNVVSSSSGGSIPSDYSERSFTTIVNGNYAVFTFLVK